MSKSNVDYTGHVIDPSKTVNVPCHGSNVDYLNNVIDPSKSVYEDIDDDYIEGVGSGATDIFSIALGILIGPAILVSFLVQLIDSFRFLYELLYIPSVIIVVLTTVLFSKFGEKFKIGKLNDMKFRKIFLVVNSICGFIVVYVSTSSFTLRHIENIERSFNNSTATNTMSGAFIALWVDILLYLLRIIIPSIIVPLVQKLIWKVCK